MLSIEHRIAAEIAAKPSQVIAAIALLDEGATVPFIARYRKEATDGLDDTQLRNLEERLGYLRELEERRGAIIESVREQGKLSEELEAQLRAAETKSRLEDLYLPYKPKRRTKAQIAREAGLEPLADALHSDQTKTPEELAATFVNPEKGVADSKAALDGARHILLERFSEDSALVGKLRDYLYGQGVLRAKLVAGKEKDGAKFSDYFDFSEALKSIPSHRALAVFRARSEGILDIDLEPGAQAEAAHALCEGMVAAHVGVRAMGRPGDAWMLETCRQAWRIKLHVHLMLDLLGSVRERAEEEAIRVFGMNMKDLLLAAPAGHKVVMGLDPGIRTGVKVAIVDATSKVVFTSTIYPHEPKNQWQQSIEAIAAASRQFGVQLVSIGNGTASRETDALVGEVIQKYPELKLQKIVVNEAGASVYSASAVAAKEFPDLDVSLRGAVSIARRLQDPLAELVKIDPKAIGVGQYQHDVNQIKLGGRLDAVVEDCVNAVGVDVNTASAALLTRVAGLNQGLAENIVKFRESNGSFGGRSAIKAVPRLGPKAFEQCAGFLRIQGGENPLDASGVHPESYRVVEKILQKVAKPIAGLIGDVQTLRGLRAEDFADDAIGVPTVKDIIKELEKPGRDPRPEFKTARFADGITEIKHLQVGMVLEGVVSNVTAFGAFVDLGVHQDGLVHISQLAQKYVKDPRDVVKAGQIVKVKVMEVDVNRKRIALSMRLDEAPPAPSSKTGDARGRESKPQNKTPVKPAPQPAKTAPAPLNLALADAFKSALKR
jgi:protein Tex